MVERGVGFVVGVFAAVVEDGGGEDGVVPGVSGGDALHVEEVEGKADDGLCVPDEATLAQGVGGVVFAGCACGHGPEAAGRGGEDVLDEGAEAVVADEGDFGVQGLMIYY